MELVKEYLIQNFALILVLLAFAIMLKATIFLDKKTIRRLFTLIIYVFLLSIIVYIEFHLTEIKQYDMVRLTMIAIRYSSTPFITAMILYTLVKRAHWIVFIPAAILLLLNIVSIFTGIVFSLDPTTKEMVRAGFMGYLPYIVVGLYSAVLLFILIYQSDKRLTDIIPILFLGFAFISGLVFPFLFGKDYSKIFCTTIAVGLFVYYVFLILQLTKKDALTGLLNRQAYYSMVDIRGKEITAVLSVDMNGLKAINDRGGHLDGDRALIQVANCLKKSIKGKQEIFRIGGDEFVFLCLKTNRIELEWVAASIKENLSSTPYSCSIGYCYRENPSLTIEEMVKKSDEMMYADKARHYNRRSTDRKE